MIPNDFDEIPLTPEEADEEVDEGDCPDCGEPLEDPDECEGCGWTSDSDDA